MKKIAFVLILLAAPFLAEACPMCQGGEGFSSQSILAYKITTAFLASLPILLGFGIFWWVRRRLRSSG